MTQSLSLSSTQNVIPIFKNLRNLFSNCKNVLVKEGGGDGGGTNEKKKEGRGGGKDRKTVLCPHH